MSEMLTVHHLCTSSFLGPFSGWTAKRSIHSGMGMRRGRKRRVTVVRMIWVSLVHSLRDSHVKQLRFVEFAAILFDIANVRVPLIKT